MDPEPLRGDTISTIKFACPACSARLRIGEELSGGKVRCRACEKVILAPLEGDAPDIRIVEREPDPDALQALTVGDGPKGGARRRIAFGVGLAIVGLSFLLVLWAVFFPAAAVPEIVSELPEGDFFVYRSSAGAAFFHPETHDFGDAREMVTVFRGRERMESLTIYRGDFAVKTITDGLVQRGYVAQKINDESLLLYPRSDEAVHVTHRRILSGRRDLVLEALRVRKGKAKSFIEGLTHVHRRTLDRLSARTEVDLLYFGKAPSVAERTYLATYTRGLLQHVTPGPGGLGLALRIASRDRASLTAAIAFSDSREEVGARDSLSLLGEFVQGLEIQTNDRAVVARGTLRPETLTWRANEAEAVAALRRIATAQAEFREGDRDRNSVKDFWTGDVSCLHRLYVNGVAIAVLERDLAAADYRPRGAGEEEGRVGVVLPRQAWRGYWFGALENAGAGGTYLTDPDGNGTFVHHLQAFGLCAVPDRHRVTGEYTFLLNEQGELWRKDTNGEPVREWLADPAKEGWVRVRP